MTMQRNINRSGGSRYNRRYPSLKELKSVRLSTILRLWDELLTNKNLLILTLTIVIMNALLGIAGPFLIGYTLDQLIYQNSNIPFIYLLAGLVLVYILFSTTTYLQNYWMIGISQDTVFNMRSKLFSHFHRLPISFFDKRQHGELMSRITNDMDNVSQTLNSSVIQVASSIITLLGTITVMLILSPVLTAVTLVIVPMMFLGMRWITSRTGRLFKIQQHHLGELNGFIEETVSGQKIVKTYSQEESVFEEFLEKSSNLREAAYWAQTYSGFIPKLMNMLNNLSFAIIAFIGGVFAIHGMFGVTIGLIVTFSEYARQFTRPLNDLANQFNTMLSAIAGAERVFDIIDLESEDKDEENSRELHSLFGEIEYKNVSFSYEKDNETITDINFVAKSGETIALVGPTGAGKTTIINLLTRFYDPNEGVIYIDGKKSTEIKRASLRNHIGFVLQDVFLFQNTIRENIRFGRLDATDEEVVEAAKQANAHTFIMKLPNGYDTILSQDGSGISHGQKQLISIARAILKDPTILILDEATSNIDTVTEIKIQEALGKLMKGRTSFVIAHRLNTIQNADQILVLKEGQIIEQGTHEELLKLRGFYYELYQSKGSVQEEVG